MQKFVSAGLTVRVSRDLGIIAVTTPTFVAPLLQADMLPSMIDPFDRYIIGTAIKNKFHLAD